MEVTVPLIGAIDSTDSRHELQARASEGFIKYLPPLHILALATSSKGGAQER